MRMQLLNKCVKHSQEFPFSFTSCGIKARHLTTVTDKVTFKWKGLIKLMSWYKR